MAPMAWACPRREDEPSIDDREDRAALHHSGSRAIAVLAQNVATPNYSVNHARSGSNRCSASLAPWLISVSEDRARRAHRSFAGDWPDFVRVPVTEALV